MEQKDQMHLYLNIPIGSDLTLTIISLHCSVTLHQAHVNSEDASVNMIVLLSSQVESIGKLDLVDN
ncbi:hypothetical protein CHS0354_008137 [Potamilus streckersoni]|uniref:Uncharacterized protein n=1 Tax=Potamilus streckersoni TaxID=2493646 RepID=A0AAE0SZH2_9BIVA|nr:hypothetical protein CHS0354_008137 [Potamilus streckersoni]